MCRGTGRIGPLDRFEQPTDRYLTTLKEQMDAAIDGGIELQEAIAGLDQSPWQGLADFEALAGRNAPPVYPEREAAAFE